MTAKLLLCTGILAAIGLGESVARPDASKRIPSSYRGAHAIPSAEAGEFCYIAVAHTHTYPPDASMRDQFVERDDGARFEFIGDPTEYHFQGMSFAYYGAHPMHFDGELEARVPPCERIDEHSHLRAPANVSNYEERRGTYYFASYRQARRVARASRRSARSDRRSTRAKRSSSTSSFQVSSLPASSSAKTRRTATKAAEPASPPPTPKPDPHRSWMNRRLGR